MIQVSLISSNCIYITQPVMNIPGIDYSTQSHSTSEDRSLFHEVILEATRRTSSQNSTTRITFDNSAAGGISHSYKFVTGSAVSVSASSSSQSDLSACATQLTPRCSQTTYNQERSGSSILQESWSQSYDESHEHVFRSYSNTSIELSAIHGFNGRGNGNRRPVIKPDDSEGVQPTVNEVLGWLLCEVGVCGFKAMLWVFFPLLIFSLFAASSSFLVGKSTVADAVHCPYNVTVRDPRCLKVCDSFTEDLTTTTGSLGSNATRSSGVTILEILSARSWQPAELIAGMLGASVVVQLVQFTITSPLLDYCKSQTAVLWLGAGIGLMASGISINLFPADWWWIGGVLFLFCTVGVGLVSTWLDSYLSCLARGIPVLKTQLFDEVQIFQSVRIRFICKLSLTGLVFGGLSGTACSSAAFLFLRSSLVPRLLEIHPQNWALRIACSVGGIWLLFWTVMSSAFFLKDRSGPGLRYIPHPPRKHLLMAVFRLRIGRAGKERSGLLLLLVCFLSSLGNATVFHSGFLCFSPTNFIKLVLLSQLSSLAGTVVFLLVQTAFSWSNKVMLLIALLIHLLLPIYACLGLFFNAASRKKLKLLGLNRDWEFLVFAFAFGLCLGAHRSYIRTLFLICIPQPTLVGAYFSLLALVNQLSTFVGSMEVFLFVRYNGDLRYTFVIMTAALLLATILLIFIVVAEQQDFEVVSPIDLSTYTDSNFVKSSLDAFSKSNSGSFSRSVPTSLRTQYTLSTDHAIRSSFSSRD